MEFIYCPYTDKLIDPKNSSPEHIFPLSLGGSNQFTLPVDAAFNSQLGSKVDGTLANDFLILMRRNKFNTRGHSNKKPLAKSSHATMGESHAPVQVEFSNPDGLRVYDPVKRRHLKPKEFYGQNLNLRFILSQWGRLRFSAKVALSAGYFIFGDWFRNNVEHGEIRALMNLKTNNESDFFRNFGLRAYDQFSQPKEGDKQDYALDNCLCQAAAGSCVYFVPGPVNLGVTVGILGQHISTLNVPANTDNFPFSNENDLGHAIILKNGKMLRMSFRDLNKLALDRLAWDNKEIGIFRKD